MFDAIVIGARVAGSPTAMLLARMGYDVLLVDRATFPSDTFSTHVVHAPGVAALQRWGLLAEVVASGCPALESYAFDFGPLALRGTTRPVSGVSTGYAPRRTVLDDTLVQAAARAGAHVRAGFTVDSLVVEEGAVVGIRHGSTEERARVVVGADGRNSLVARSVRATAYNTKPRLQYGCYTYFSDLQVDGLETYVRPDRGFGCARTNDGLTMVVGGWPYTQAREFAADLEANFLATLRLVPSVADRLTGANREAPLRSGAVPGYLRTPYGAGWALIGDAGYNKDPITAQGISDAFWDAERCTIALDEWLSGRTTYDKAMSGWHRERDNKVMPMYEFTSQMATLDPPPPEMLQLLAAVSSDQVATDGFVSVVAGTLSPAEYFSEENVGRILASARQPAAEVLTPQ